MKKLFAPGPSQCDPKYLKILGEPVKYHRTAEFYKLFMDCHEMLKPMFKTTKGKTLILPGSGTNGMDSSVQNAFKKGEKVLVINVGFFGERFKQITNAFKLDVISLDYNWGETYNIEDVKKVIEENTTKQTAIITPCLVIE